MDDLNKKSFGGLIFLILALAALLFIPAGTIDYWQAWVFLSVFFASTLLITVYLMKNDPELLERRINAGPVAEKEKQQKVIQSLASLAFIALFIVSALDHRFGWSIVPVSAVAAGNVLVVLGLFAVFLVFKENSYASAIIEVGAAQKVISTGPYAIVRHPMYAGAFVMLLGIPLALGSRWGLIAVVPIVAAIVWRLLDEEKFLEENLDGYLEYQKKVKYRLVPFIW
jgi:protein-S-isoprenylcysteine O-methyltransferase Ste14